MEWVCVVLIVGTMVYSGSIVVDYLNYDIAIRPQIAKLKRQAFELADCADVEIEERDKAQARSHSYRPEIEDLHQAIEVIRRKVKAESIRKNRLEMVLLKSSLRHTPRLNMVLG